MRLMKLPTASGRGIEDNPGIYAKTVRRRSHLLPLLFITSGILYITGV